MAESSELTVKTVVSVLLFCFLPLRTSVRVYTLRWGVGETDKRLKADLYVGERAANLDDANFPDPMDSDFHKQCETSYQVVELT